MNQKIAINPQEINPHASGPINQQTYKRIEETLDKALKEHPRTLVLRIDLYIPDRTFNADSKQMTRFIASLNAQIDADIQKRSNTGVRVHPCTLRFVWAREFHQDGRKHYHAALFLNKDTYAYPGTYHPDENGDYTHNLSLMIMESWVRTLKLNKEKEYQKHYTLINFTDNGYYHLNKNQLSFITGYPQVLNRLRYLAKEYSKDNSDGQRNFGCSQY
ncbi:inovirus Gp2 family protein [Serratia fonticola]|uniref:inovirus Gp2 family protein n=1 Tax=Serratia fonticola TaxID=47917 RepID=UPI0034C62646